MCFTKEKNAMNNLIGTLSLKIDNISFTVGLKNVDVHDGYANV